MNCIGALAKNVFRLQIAIFLKIFSKSFLDKTNINFSIIFKRPQNQEEQNNSYSPIACSRKKGKEKKMK
jgi:hypothetical protein